ncbi:MAG: hypothetical protein ACI4ES_08070 [Roseburia sp.]
MEMCYEEALVMPSSYAIMNEEEMTYVEGGVKAVRYMRAVQAEKELKMNATLYAAIAGGLGVATAATSITGLPAVIAFCAAGGAGIIAEETYSAWKQAKAIRLSHGAARWVIVTEEVTMLPPGYSCNCVMA